MLPTSIVPISQFLVKASDVTILLPKGSKHTYDFVLPMRTTESRYQRAEAAVTLGGCARLVTFTLLHFQCFELLTSYIPDHIHEPQQLRH